MYTPLILVLAQPMRMVLMVKVVVMVLVVIQKTKDNSSVINNMSDYAVATADETNDDICVEKTRIAYWVWLIITTKLGYKLVLDNLISALL